MRHVGRHKGLVEFTGCRSDLSMHLREHVFHGEKLNQFAALFSELFGFSLDTLSSFVLSLATPHPSIL